MRLRNIPGAEEYIYSVKKYSIENPVLNKGKWRDVFANDNPIHVEFGMGKGRFITTLAKNNPNINYIGVECKAEVIYKAIKNIEDEEISNLRILLFNVNDLENLFDENEIDRIYLNFSDPWHKEKHKKRRLTHENYLKKYRNCIKEDGWIHFKTDNRRLFQFSLNEFAHLNLKMQNISLDLHCDNLEDNIMTEYEEKFASKGHPIFRVEVSLKNLI